MSAFDEFGRTARSSFKLSSTTETKSLPKKYSKMLAESQSDLKTLKSTQVDQQDAQTKPKKGQVWWMVVFLVSLFHAISLYAILFHTPSKYTLWLTLLTWVFGGLGITMGYHRLWSHNAFHANYGVRLALSLCAVMAYQGSIKWWSLRHRLHHRYTDTEHDPYDATRGFWYSHMGWLFEKPVYTRLKWIDKSDLDADPGTLNDSNSL
jgi:stearoyl-CoA desaturase (delta-9 desaturase)